MDKKENDLLGSLFGAGQKNELGSATIKKFKKLFKKFWRKDREPQVVNASEGNVNLFYGQVVINLKLEKEDVAVLSSGNQITGNINVNN